MTEAADAAPPVDGAATVRLRVPLPGVARRGYGVRAELLDRSGRVLAAAESAVTDSQTALEAAGAQFCVDAESYIEVLDRYGKLFTDDAATVGDVQTLGADLVEPRETVTSSKKMSASG